MFLTILERCSSLAASSACSFCATELVAGFLASGKQHQVLTMFKHKLEMDVIWFLLMQMLQMSAAETGQMSAVETRQMSAAVSTADICPVSAADIGPVSTADMSSVARADICVVSTADNCSI